MNPWISRSDHMSVPSRVGAGAGVRVRVRVVPNILRLPILLLFSSILLLALLVAPTTAYTELSDDQLSEIPAIDDLDFDIADNNRSLLAPLLIPRVPGTPGQEAAQEHLASFFRDELPRWELSWQNSTDTTPATGNRQIPFANLILRRHPIRKNNSKGGGGGQEEETRARTGYLTLAAHYDSKLKPDGFIGATDSAAPCAMLLHVARTLEPYLARKWGEDDEGEGEGEGASAPRRRRRDGHSAEDKPPADDVGVQILLLDGEEAFVSWTATDSLYGARSLAEEWDTAVNPALSTYRNPLGQISLFVLLDLLGSAGASVPSYFLTTHWAYQAMAHAEERLRGLGLLETDAASGSGSGRFLRDAEKKPSEFRRSGVEDDHIPFLRRGVPVLHLIASPFPHVWHTLDDDGEHLDLPTVRDWARVVTAFALEWLDVGEHDGDGDGVGVTPPPPAPESAGGDGAG